MIEKETSKKKAFVEVLQGGVEKFKNNRQHLKYMIGQLKKIFTHWQDDLGHKHYSVLYHRRL